MLLLRLRVYARPAERMRRGAAFGRAAPGWPFRFRSRRVAVHLPPDRVHASANVRYACRLGPCERHWMAGTSMSSATTAVRATARALPRWLAVLSTAVLGACAQLGLGGDPNPPVVFVHGNGSSAAQWQTTIWRFESNGWPRGRLYAIDFPYPYARDDDATPQPGRSSTAEQMQHLSAEIDRVLASTGARKVALVGHSRGGLAIRNYVKNGKGADKVSHVVLGGTPNHGIWSTDFRLGSEFNGKGPFLTALNAPQGPWDLEVTPGPRWLTLRSDGNDKYAQPDGRWIGRPGMATGVTSDSPALRGAKNLVLGSLDHREVSFHPRAFEQTWWFLTGQLPTRTGIVAESVPVLDGRINRPGTNLPMAGVSVQVYEVAPQTGERLGQPVHVRTTGPDGQWGPMQARPDAPYEFVIAAPGFATTHIYRSAFPRSSDVVHMRPVRLTDAERRAGSVVTMTRPRGYFDVRRDRMSLDGAAPPGVPPGVAAVNASKLVLPPGAVRTVVAEFNSERIAVRTWPASQNRAVFAELHY